MAHKNIDLDLLTIYDTKLKTYITNRGSGVSKGNSQPTDTSLLWFDTSNSSKTLLKVYNETSTSWETLNNIPSDYIKDVSYTNDILTITKADGTTIDITITSGSGSGGVSDYTSLTGKPTLNSVEIDGNKSSSDYDLLGTEHNSATNAHQDIRDLISDNTTNLTSHTTNTDIHVSTTDRNLLTALNHNKGTFGSESALRNAYPTATSGDYCVCYNGTNYTIWTYNTDWVDTGQLGNVTSVNNMTGDITLDANNVNYQTGVTLKTQIDINKSNLEKIIGDLSTLPTVDKTSITNAITEVFQDVDNGKTLIASAITDKGILTSKNDTFQTMLENLCYIKAQPNSIGYIISTKSTVGSTEYITVVLNKDTTIYTESVISIDKSKTDNADGSITLSENYTTITFRGYLTAIKNDSCIYLYPNSDGKYYITSNMKIINENGDISTNITGLNDLTKPCVIL